MAERALELTQMGQGCGYYMHIEFLASPSASSSTPKQLRSTCVLQVQPEEPQVLFLNYMLMFLDDLPKNSYLLLKDPLGVGARFNLPDC